jgi:hypothetical protein
MVFIFTDIWVCDQKCLETTGVGSDAMWFCLWLLTFQMESIYSYPCLGPCGIIMQKTTFDIFTAVRTTDITQKLFLLCRTCNYHIFSLLILR